MKTRQQLLMDLLDDPRNADRLVAGLQSFPWDTDAALVQLERRHIAAALQLFLSGSVSATQLEAWANAIEGREDIGLEAQHEALLQDIIVQLANPLLGEPIAAPLVTDMLGRVV